MGTLKQGNSIIVQSSQGRVAAATQYTFVLFLYFLKAGNQRDFRSNAVVFDVACYNGVVRVRDAIIQRSKRLVFYSRRVRFQYLNDIVVRPCTQVVRLYAVLLSQLAFGVGHAVRPERLSSRLV